MEKFKNILKKIGSGLLALGMTFSAIPSTTVYGAEGNTGRPNTAVVYDAKSKLNLTMGSHTNIQPHKIYFCPGSETHNHNGLNDQALFNAVYNCPLKQEMFCIDINKGMPDNKLYKGSPKTPEELKEKVIEFLQEHYFNKDRTKAEEAFKKVGYVQAAGYGFKDEDHPNGDFTREMYEATQMLIWEYGNGAQYESGATSEVKTLYDTIKRRVEDAIKTPNFVGNKGYNYLGKDTGEVELNGYGKENAITLTDSEKVLHLFAEGGKPDIVVNNNKLHLEIEGNICKVWADKGYTGSAGSILAESHYLMDNKSTVKSGFFYDGQDQTQSLISGGLDPTKFGIKVKMNLTGEATVEKQDKETGEHPQGDTTFKGAQFKLYYDKNCTDPVPNQPVITVNEKGKPNKSWTKLNRGKTYYVKEEKTPAGYLLNNKPVKLSFKLVNGKYKASITIKDTVIKGKVQVHKYRLEDGSGIPVNEKGAEFTLYDKDNKKIASFTTNDKGIGVSPLLPYGSYTMKQTKAPFGTEIDPHTYSVVIKNNNQTVKLEPIVNIQQDYTLAIVKKDAETGALISYTGAKFRVYKDEGKAIDPTKDKPLSVKVGSRTYDTFITKNATTVSGTSSEFFATDEEAGTVITPLQLKAGKYILHEIKSPKGYMDHSQETSSFTKFTVGEGSLTEDKDGNALITVEIKNTPIKQRIAFKKTIEQMTNKANYDLAQIEYEIVARNDVVNFTTGAVIAKAGEVVQTLKGEIITNETQEKYKDIVIGNIPENKPTLLFVSDFLPEGEYTLRETKTREGLILDKTEHTIIVSGSSLSFIDDLNRVNCGAFKGTIPEIITFVNKETETTFSKENVGGKEVIGAKLQVKDRTGNVLDEWTSTNETHIVYGLTEGETYVLHEDLAPAGMNSAQDIHFTVGAKSTVKMVDTITSISKTDSKTRKNLEGATLVVKTRSGEILDIWKSKKEPHTVKGLRAGETYVLQEVKAPKGYRKNENPISFTVSGDKDTVIQIMNTPLVYGTVHIEKVDSQYKNKNIKGAHLQVLDETGEVVSEWTSNGQVHVIKNLDTEKTYTIHEVKAPEGYEKGKDQEFRVKVGKITSIKYENSAYKITGVGANTMPMVVGGIALTILIGLGGYEVYKKVKRKNK